MSEIVRKKVQSPKKIFSFGLRAQRGYFLKIHQSLRDLLFLGVYLLKPQKNTHVHVFKKIDRYFERGVIYIYDLRPPYIYPYIKTDIYIFITNRKQTYRSVSAS